MQRRFENRRGVRALRLLTHKLFRAAYDFLLLRARCGEVDQELADWWTEVQTMSAADQRKAFAIKRHRQRRRPSSRNSSASAAN
jgi:poly(A) polymerase